MSRLDYLTLLVGLAGAAAVTAGMSLLHAAAGWMVGGGFALAWSWMTARSAGRGS
ncbi:hypothetical protein [Chromobacterium violaceum]|uniref:hypothetical protein n=1 Tax=Chromobacterium violaceum TaxID=536 RepID=UPI001592B58A|nr:hypothetical protein [Chromobacterium violaceum]